MSVFENFKFQTFLKEYEDLGYHLRLIATFRIGVLSVFPALVGALVRFMWEISQREYGVLLRILLPFGGFIATIIVVLVDRRLVPFYDVLIKRGQELEEVFDIHHGIYHRIVTLPATFALRMVSLATLIAIGALFFAIFIVQLVALIEGTI